MWGAVVGDIVGSRFEFANDLPVGQNLLGLGSAITDETVCIAGLAEACLNRQDLSETLRSWCKRYPDLSYGSMFKEWVYTDDLGPYYSYGNGCLARVSVAVAFASNPSEARLLAKRLSAITHDHPDSIRICETLSESLFKIKTAPANSRRGHLLAILSHLSIQIPDSRQTFLATPEPFSEHVLHTVGPSLLAVHFGDSFEDVMRIALKRGGDVDTICSLAGVFAEPFFGVPQSLLLDSAKRTPEEIRRVLERSYGRS